MLSFHSINNLFHLKLPKQSNYEFKDNIYIFFKEDEFNGVIQISAYFNKSKVFELSKEYQKEKNNTLKLKFHLCQHTKPFIIARQKIMIL